MVLSNFNCLVMQNSHLSLHPESMDLQVPTVNYRA